MDSELYREIFYEFLPSYIGENEGITILHQDNDSKHCSLICRNAVRGIGLKWVNKKYFTTFIFCFLLTFKNNLVKITGKLARSESY